MRALIAAAVLLVAWPAGAQQLRMCPGGQSYEEIESRLTRSYAERRNARAVMASGRAVVEFWSNPSTGTWTVIAITPQGCSWALSSGEGWESMTPAVGDDGA